MPEWLIERGIGEDRAVRLAGGEIVEARVMLHGIARAGSTLSARLKGIAPRAVAEADGEEYLLPKGAAGLAEGARIIIEVTRERIPGAEPWKRPMAKLARQAAIALAEIDAAMAAFPSPADFLGTAGWWDLIDEARSGLIQFAGGELRVSATPAMTLIDVDGYLPPDELAVVGAFEAAKIILRLDIGGSIGIDLPATSGKGARQAAAAAIDTALAQPFERTAVNGFGFVQIVRPRARASLVELAQDRAAFEARALLRRAAFETPGPKRLVGHPAVVRVIEENQAWLDALGAQVGGAVALRAEPALPMSGNYVEPA